MEDSGGIPLGLILWIIIGIAVLSACGVISLTLAGLTSLLTL